MTPRKKRLTVLLVAALVATIAYVRYSDGGPDDRPTVERGVVSRGPVTETVEAVGTLQPVRTVSVGSQVSGVVTALHADFNSMVKKGEIIAELDPSQFKMQVAVQQANVDEQTTAIALLRVQLANDQKTLARMEAQFHDGLISQQEVENAVLQVRLRAAQITSAQDTKVAAQAQVLQAKLNVSYCTIRSPIDGVVVSRIVDIGQTVQSSMTTPQFFTLASPVTALRLAAAVDEADISHIRPGAPVTFTVDTYRGRTFHGRVEDARLDAQISNNVVTYPVWIDVENPDRDLRPSMTVTLRIFVGSAPHAILVPNAALAFRPTADIYSWLGMPEPAWPLSPRPLAATAQVQQTVSGQPVARISAPSGKIDDLFARVPKKISAASVWIYDEGNPDPGKKLREIPIQTGLTDGESTEVVSGDLTPGMTLVTKVIPPERVLEQRAHSIFGGPPRTYGGMRQVQKKLPTLRRGR